MSHREIESVQRYSAFNAISGLRRRKYPRHMRLMLWRGAPEYKSVVSANPHRY